MRRTDLTSTLIKLYLVFLMEGRGFRTSLMACFGCRISFEFNASEFQSTEFRSSVKPAAHERNLLSYSPRVAVSSCKLVQLCIFTAQVGKTTRHQQRR